MRGGLGMLILLATLSPLAGAADWAQWRAHADGSSSTLDAGPDAPEVALVIPIESPGLRRQVLVGGGFAFALTRQGLLRIDLASARSLNILPLDAHDSEWATFALDRDHAYVLLPDRVQALTLDGEAAWSVPFPRLTQLPRETECRPPTLAGAMLYLSCSQWNFTGPQPPVAGDYTSLADRAEFHAALPTTGGSFAWIKLVDTTPSEGVSAYAPHAVVLGDVLITPVERFARAGSQVEYELREPATGDLIRKLVGNATAPSARDLRDPESSPSDFATLASLAPTGTPDEFYLMLGDLRAVDPAGDPLWSVPVPHPLDVPWYRALRGDSLYLASGQELGVVSLANHEYQTWDIVQEGEVWGPTAASGSGVFALHRKTGEGATDQVPAQLAPTVGVNPYSYSLRAFGPTGEPRWTMGLGQTGGFLSGNVEISVSGDALFVMESNAIKVIGRVPASIHPALAVETTYPPVGSLFRIDATGTKAGAQSPSTEQRVDWGDGTVTAWGSATVFEHAYVDAGERLATLYVRNEAGQTAQESVLLHVGSLAPRTPGLVETALSSEYQNWTFFLLGLAVTAVGGAFGIVRPRQRRARLRGALAAVDEAFERTRADPLVCEREMTRQREAARASLLAGRLGEDQFTVIAAHIGERTGEARVAFLRSRYAFLPLGVTEQLRAMLADGAVTRLEHQHLLAAVDADATMTPEQKQQVRALLSQWAARDA